MLYALYILTALALVVAGYLMLHRLGVVPDDRNLSAVPRTLLRLAALPATLALLALGAVLIVCGVAVEMVLARLRRRARRG